MKTFTEPRISVEVFAVTDVITISTVRNQWETPKDP